MVPLLNLDAGELESETEELWSLFDLLACACGGHAGDAASMARVAAFCAGSGTRLGAHPSYPDRAGFGRTSVTISPADLRGAIASQCRALSTIAAAAGIAITAVKPHGALYHDAAVSPAIAEAMLDGVADAIAISQASAAMSVASSEPPHLANDVPPRIAINEPHVASSVAIIGPPRGALFEAAQRRALRYLREGFADRRMRADRSLVPRSEPDALITDPAAAARQAAQLDADTICIHADTPGAIAIARAVREALRG